MPPPQTLAELLFPARDPRFDSVIRELSQPEPGPFAENLVSNEDSYPRIAGDLDRLVAGDGVYLGVGPDQNFSLIAHARPELALIVDFRRRNLLLHLVHKALFCLAEERVGYLRRLLCRQPARLRDDPSGTDLVAGFRHAPLDRARLRSSIADVAAFLRPLELIAEHEWGDLASIQSRLAGPGMNARFLALPMYPTLARMIEATDRRGEPAHFLARESFYQRVRDLHLGDRILPIVGDYGRGPCLPAIGSWLKRHSLRVSLLYISDVEFFLLRAGRFAAYTENLRRLPWKARAFVARTSTREIGHAERMAGDSSTTVVRPIETLLAPKTRPSTLDDLFRGVPSSP